MSKNRPVEPSGVEEVPANNELQARFGFNLRTFRKSAGLTQVQLAELSGINQTEISQIELGKVNLTLARMETLARIVDHDVSHLLSPSKK